MIKIKLNISTPLLQELYILIYNRKCTEYKHNKLQIDSNNELSNL